MFVLGAGIAVSQDSPPVAGHRSSVAVVTELQVQCWLKLWQKRLSLDDWQITAHIVRSRELKPETLGNLRWNSATKTAAIRVMSAVDYDLPAPEIPIDMEYTLVHELVHLQLVVMPKAPESKEIEERIVNRIGEALFALDKGPSYRRRATLGAQPFIKDKVVSEASRASK